MIKFVVLVIFTLILLSVHGSPEEKKREKRSLSVVKGIIPKSITKYLAVGFANMIVRLRKTISDIFGNGETGEISTRKLIRAKRNGFLNGAKNVVKSEALRRILKSILKEVIKLVKSGIKWTGIITASNVASNAIDRKLTGATAKSDRTYDNCNTNGFGCLKGLCWRHCGPRLRSADWCYANKNGSTEVNFLRCNDDTDCSPCNPCSGQCLTDDGVMKTPVEVEKDDDQ